MKCIRYILCIYKRIVSDTYKNSNFQDLKELINNNKTECVNHIINNGSSSYCTNKHEMLFNDIFNLLSNIINMDEFITLYPYDENKINKIISKK